MILFTLAGLALLPLSRGIADTKVAPLPYTNRTSGYSGWSSTVRGDIRTMGMAGAMVGLADTFIAAGDNPAGLAMTLENVAATAAGNSIRDGYLQDYDAPITSTSLGAAASAYPWGFSIGYWVPQNAGQTFRLLNGQTLDAEFDIREIRMSAARLFLENRLSVGASLIVGQAAKILDYPSGDNVSEHTTRLGASVGAMYQFPSRILLGVNYTLPIFYPTNPLANPTAGITNFYQPIRTPYRIAFGTGYIPNRFLRMGAAIYIIGATPGAALLSDDSRPVGEKMTVQPRLGFAYTLAEFRQFKTEIAMGTYYEPSRVSMTADRIHGTLGLDVNLWIFNIGFGLDEAPHYENQVFSIGLDIVRLFRTLDLIPPDKRPPLGGYLPNPFYSSDEGLARPLMKNWNEKEGQQTSDIIEIGRGIPKRIEERLNELSTPPDPVDSTDYIDTRQVKPSKKRRGKAKDEVPVLPPVGDWDQ